MFGMPARKNYNYRETRNSSKEFSDILENTRQSTKSSNI